MTTSNTVGGLPELIAYAEGRISHINNGNCPDGVLTPEVRDRECPVCQALVALARQAEPDDAMFGRIIKADFSENTLTLEMEPGYRAFAGRVAMTAAQPQGEVVPAALPPIAAPEVPHA